MISIVDSFRRLKEYCERERFKGWDPYDGLNSQVFKALPLVNKSSLCRLVMIQAFKRLPFNLRPLALIPKDYNPKGLALFVQGYCNLYHLVEKVPTMASSIGTLDEIKSRIVELADLLISLKSKGDYHGACWGYNFDWQIRNVAFFPAYTPTVVATSFASTALFAAADITGNEQYKLVALSSADFILNDLQRTPHGAGFFFSYSPLEGWETDKKVLNATLLGARALSFCYQMTGYEHYKSIARETIATCCAEQNDDGSWIYGATSTQQWIDSFHTGYNLDSIQAYEQLTGDATFHAYLEKGFDFYINNFFDKDGSPKYYNNKQYPIDIHCPAQLLATLARLDKYGEYKQLADKVLAWTIENMQDPKGYFYYQLKQGINSKIPYMRWSNAFMFYGMSYYLLETCNQ